MMMVLMNVNRNEVAALRGVELELLLRLAEGMHARLVSLAMRAERLGVVDYQGVLRRAEVGLRSVVELIASEVDRVDVRR
jgi:hypothetical protein